MSHDLAAVESIAILRAAEDRDSANALLPEEWRLLKALRLEALSTNPSVFGNSFAHESQFPDSQWQQRFFNSNLEC